MDKRTIHAIWALVALVAMILTAAVIIVTAGADVTVVLAVMGTLAVPAMGIFGAVIYQKLQQVKDVGNGTLSRSLEQNNENNKALLMLIQQQYHVMQTLAERTASDK